MDTPAHPGSGDCEAGPTGSPRPSRRVPRRGHGYTQLPTPSDAFLRLLSLSLHPPSPNRHRPAPNPAPPHLSSSSRRAGGAEQQAGRCG
uniref:Uncharacterized protein n=1 Tax=Aegilops tauschii subsp. strangulata TaxID=200361 RepID=A0A452ZZI2_AEGTS